MSDPTRGTKDMVKTCIIDLPISLVGQGRRRLTMAWVQTAITSAPGHSGVEYPPVIHSSIPAISSVTRAACAVLAA